MRLNRFKQTFLALIMLSCFQQLHAQQCPSVGGCPTEPAQLYITADNLAPTPGSTVCYTVFVRGFQSAITAQFTLTFSRGSLRYSSDNRNVSGLPDFGNGFLEPSGNSNIYRAIWFDQMACPKTLPDDTPILEVCFEVIGDPGEEIQVEIGRNGLQSDMEISFFDDNQNLCPNVDVLPILDEDSNMTPTEVAANCSGGFQVFTNEICGTPTTINAGRARLDFFCGTGPYIVTPPNGMSVGNITDDFFEADDLSDGPNIFNVQDANGDVRIVTIDVQVANVIDIGITDIRHPRCFEETNPRGSIELNISGGTPFDGGEYDYDWGGANLGRDAMPELNNLENGEYTVIIRDSLRCAATETFTLNTTEVQVLPSFLAAQCDGVPTGQISLEASGGNPDADFGYRFRITGIDNFGNLVNRSMETSTANTLTFDNLPAGTYTAWAEDEDLVSLTCDPDSVTITVTTIVTYDIEAIPNPDVTATCPNVGDISMQLTLSNNAANPAASYDYTITTVDSDGNVTTLPVTSGSSITDNVIIECLPFGEYEIQIFDSDGCTFVNRFVVDGCDLIVTEGFTISPDCADPNTAQTTVDISGGQMPYDIAWSTGETTQTITMVPAGTYDVTVTDANMCVDSITIVIDPADLVSVVLNASDMIMCPGGTIDIEASPQGGFAPYTYTWSPDPTGTTTDVLQGVGAGTYDVIIEDDTGCTGTTSITITEPTPPQFNLQTPVAPGCQGDSSGATNVTVLPNSDFGGDFVFESSSGEMGLTGFTFSPSRLAAGDQWILVSHVASGCVFDTINFVVPEGQPLQLDRDNSDFGSILCFGEEAFVTLDALGNSNVSFEWPAPINITSAQTFAPAGTYVVTLTAGSCMSIDSFDVVQPDSFGVAVDPFASSPPNCPDELGSLVANRVGGVDPVSFRWEDASGMVLSTDMDLNGVGPGTYMLFATDANGCTSDDIIDITVPDPVEGFIGMIDQPFCFGDLGRVFIDSARGGIGPYRYQVDTNPATNLSDTSSVPSGDHTITIFDVNGCRWEEMFTVDTPEEVSITINGDQLIELGRTGMLTATPISMVATDTIIWTSTDPDATFSCITNDCTQIEIAPVNNATYTATLTNIEGCTATASIDVQVNRSQNVYAPNIFTPSFSTDPFGRNQVFQIYPGSGVESIDYLRIYDRWGNLVHEEENLEIPTDGSGSGLWDGTLMVGDSPGTPLESGVYIYVFQVRFLGDPAPDIRKGDVTLVR